jgi:hypothetical protein
MVAIAGQQAFFYCDVEEDLYVRAPDWFQRDTASSSIGFLLGNCRLPEHGISVSQDGWSTRISRYQQ